eukprot:8342917-Alexandrium_andersonii.AAC.1
MCESKIAYGTVSVGRRPRWGLNEPLFIGLALTHRASRLCGEVARTLPSPKLNSPCQHDRTLAWMR